MAAPSHSGRPEKIFWPCGCSAEVRKGWQLGRAMVPEQRQEGLQEHRPGADTGCSGVSVREGPRELRKATRQICALGHGSAG